MSEVVLTLTLHEVAHCLWAFVPFTSCTPLGIVDAIGRMLSSFFKPSPPPIMVHMG